MNKAVENLRNEYNKAMIEVDSYEPNNICQGSEYIGYTEAFERMLKCKQMYMNTTNLTTRLQVFVGSVESLWTIAAEELNDASTQFRELAICKHRLKEYDESLSLMDKSKRCFIYARDKDPLDEADINDVVDLVNEAKEKYKELRDEDDLY